MSGSIAPSEPGERRPLTSHERGMLNTVVWQRDHAVPGYVEIGYDHAVWDRHAKAVAQSRGLLVSPLLAMMCWRLARLASEQPRYNATVVDDARFEYASVNLGFTVQAADRLYLAVLRDAARHDEAGFIEAMTDMQRRAAAHALEPAELAGATIAFSSMSRWNVSRHVPILAPHTALMVAHTVDARGAGKLGATYDHRVLHGGDVATLLRKVAAAPTTTTE